MYQMEIIWPTSMFKGRKLFSIGDVLSSSVRLGSLDFYVPRLTMWQHKHGMGNDLDIKFQFDLFAKIGTNEWRIVLVGTVNNEGNLVKIVQIDVEDESVLLRTRYNEHSQVI